MRNSKKIVNKLKQLEPDRVGTREGEGMGFVWLEATSRKGEPDLLVEASH